MSGHFHALVAVARGEKVATRIEWQAEWVPHLPGPVWEEGRCE
jgi:hypothetical protein